MKLTTVSAVIALLTLAGLTAASGTPEPKAPGLTYLYTVNITGGNAATVGPGPRGTRIVVPILNGTFSGPKFGKGEILLATPPLSAPEHLLNSFQERSYPSAATGS